MKNRLGIMAIYSKDGEIYEYVIYLLKKLLPFLDKLYIVCNGEMSLTSIDKIKSYAAEVFIRENKGYDVMALKYVLEKEVGFDEIGIYDELVLFNDTFFGPIFDLNVLFSTMETRICDFWSVTAQETYQEDHEIVPFHLQTYFYVIKKRMLHSKDFRDFWETFDEIRTYGDAIHKYEHQLTKFFTDKGYIADSYVRMDAYAQSGNDTFIPLYEAPYLLLKLYKCPLIKKKVFTYNKKFVRLTCEEEASNCLNYIHQYTQYDVSLIWQYLLNTIRLEELDKVLHLDYIVDEQEIDTETNINELAIYFFAQIPQSKVIAEWISSSLKINVKFFWDVNDSIRYFFFNQYVEWKKYKYICVLNDSYMESIQQMRSLLTEYYNLTENMVKSIVHVSKIVRHLSRNERLGALFLCESYHNKNFKVEVNRNYGDFGSTFSFYGKKEALEMVRNLLLFEKNIPYDLPLLMQRCGYYSERIVASGYIKNKMSFWRRNVKKIAKFYSENLTEAAYEEMLSKEKIKNFSEVVESIYIYGAGTYGKKCAKLFDGKLNFKGFLVSDGHKDQDIVLDHKIYEISEAPVSKKDGIIVAMAKSDEGIVLEMLRQKGYRTISFLSDIEDD